MSWGVYLSFLAVAAVVVIFPGPDFAVVTKNTLTGGRWRGWATSLGIACSNAVQGTAAAAGLGALIVRSQPVFDTIRWAGIGYLAYLAFQALRSAWCGDYASESIGHSRAGHGVRGFRQGFISNITNPKVLVFYLAVFPQFLSATAPPWTLAALALTHATLSLTYLVILVALMTQAKAFLQRRPVRRILDALTGAALAGFSLKLAADKA